MAFTCLLDETLFYTINLNKISLIMLEEMELIASTRKFSGNIVSAYTCDVNQARDETLTLCKDSFLMWFP